MPEFVMADTTQLAYIKETAWGTTPTTPVFTKLRLTGESFAYNPETVVSSELNPNRDVSDVILTSAGASGGFNFELSYGTFDDILASLLYADWSTNVLVNGTKQNPLTFEKRFYRGKDSDGSTDLFDFLRFTGMVANTMNLSISANEIITGSFDFMGKGATSDDEIITGATYNEAGTAPVLSASHDVGTLTLTGAGDTGYSPKIMSVSLDVNNNLQGAGVVGSVDYANIGAGSFNVSGSLELYYENLDMYAAFLAGTELKLSLTLGKTSGSKYTIEIPRLKLSSCNVVAEGQNSYVMCSSEFQGLKDSTLGATMKITRAVS